MMTKLYFCFPSRLAGGMSMLFLRIAEYLSNAGLAETVLIDYEDGTMAINRNKALTELLPYSDDDNVLVPDGSILIFQSMTPWSIYPGLSVHENVKVIFWTCHPFGLIPTFPGIRQQMQASIKVGSLVLNSLLFTFKQKMSKFTIFINSLNAIIFQDTAGVKITQNYLDITISDPKFLNIPASPSIHKKANPHQRIKSKKLLKFTWVGRIVGMKYFILKYTVAKLNSIQESLGFKIEINIIGKGDYRSSFKKDCLAFADVKINFIDHLKPFELDEFLLSETDILLAMGTSALEGAKFGIPTILLDISYREVPEGFIFTWLHERSNNAVGEILDIDNLKPGNDSLLNKAHEVIKNYAEISDKELDNFLLNHGLNNISESLLQFSKKSNLSWKMLDDKGFLEKGYLYSSLHSVRSFFIRKGFHRT